VKRFQELNFNEFNALAGTEMMSVMTRQKYLLESEAELTWIRANSTDTFYIRRQDYPAKSEFDSIAYFVSMRDVISFLELFGNPSGNTNTTAPVIESIQSAHTVKHDAG
jgi:hypothetical protein|tara:strand:+ start:11250 stop:11576 length:327 start_codon:yes stop_codon:yes gene_type:complete